VSKYTDNNKFQNLDFCKNDGEKMYKLLKSIGYSIEDGHTLIGYVKFEVMRDAIYDFFDNGKTNPNDTLLFYYSGHGRPLNDGTCLTSSEMNFNSPRRMGFSSYDLTNLIQESNSTRIVEVLDCCYSGAAKINNKGSKLDAVKLGSYAIEKDAKELRKQGRGKYLLASSHAEEESFGDKKKGHSIFTFYLLDGLKPNKHSVDSHGRVTPYTLGNYAYKLSIKKLKQKPIIKAESSGETILAKYPQYAISDHMEILKDDKVLKQSKIFMKNVREKMDICFEKRVVSYVANINTYVNGYKRIQKRNAKIRAITEINKDNIQDCEKLINKDMVMINDLRHLNGIKCGIAVSEDQFIATALLLDKIQNINKENIWLNDAVYSRKKEVVQHNQFIFDTLWENAIPASTRFREIKESHTPSNLKNI